MYIEAPPDMSKLQQLKILIIRYQEGKCSKEEIEQLRTWLRESESPELLERVYDELPEKATQKELSFRKTAIYQKIMNDARVRPALTSTGISGRALWWRKSWVAAVAAVLLVVMSFFYYSSFWGSEEKAISEEYAIVPGGDRALIILEDGREINLEEIEDTVIVQKGFSIVKKGDGAIYYQYDRAEELAVADVTNTVVTPKGGQYQVTLPDGTRVWLNAESKLKYPVYFDGNIREVELEGEGYFEVAKQTMNGKRVPFMVLSGEQKLEVLGTTFNIQAYGQDVTTTLVEGRVRLGLDNTNEKVVLQANDQAKLQPEEQQFDVRKVDPLYATAWKDGSFSFRKASIKDVMETIARWYDIDVIYKTTVDGSRFTGTISRFEQIDKLLQLIELTESVHFTIEGRRVIVEE